MLSGGKPYHLEWRVKIKVVDPPLTQDQYMQDVHPGAHTCS